MERIRKPQIENKRILKNTFFLYVRMLLTIIVGLYASRVLLEKLGFEDYGTYNVVGGIVVLFSFFGAALNSATQRFLSIKIGENDLSGLVEVFSTSVYTFFLLCAIVFVGAETIGLWFLNTRMNFPANREGVVNWVYQISIFTFLFNTIRTPYNASIISYEHMSFYAYTSVAESVLKLLIVFVIDKVKLDRLMFYALLMLSVSILLFVWYVAYCRRRFPHLMLQKKVNKACFKEMFSFSGWSLFGSLAVVGSNQGINVLLNVFFGVMINAGMGVAQQVQNVVGQFASNFQMAFNPQIVKGYANGEIAGVRNLVFLTARISFFLLFIISIPFFIDTGYVLKLWLGNVPEYASEFTFYLLITVLIEALSAPLFMTIQATGRIKTYQIVVSIILFSNLLCGYAFLKLGFSPVSVVLVRCFIVFVLLLYRIVMVSNILSFKISSFFRLVFLPILLVVSFSFLACYLLRNVIHCSQFMMTVFSLLICMLIVYFVGMKKEERDKVKKVVMSKMKIYGKRINISRDGEEPQYW